MAKSYLCILILRNNEILSQKMSLKIPRRNCVLGLGLGLDIWAAKVLGFGLDHEVHVFDLGNED